MSCLFCCFKTLTLCGLRDCLVTNAAFRPPTERKYELTLERQDLVKGSIFKMLIQEADDSKYIGQDLEGLESCIVWLDTKTNKKIPALFIDNQNCKSNFVILYSHGNSTDLGRMYKPLQELSQALNVHVFAYEYNGYGPTQGGPGEYEVIFGIMAAYEFLTEKLCFKWQNIILYGRSIGTGPSVYLASHPNYPVSGVILHSPIASGFRVFNFNTQTTDKADLFPNCDYIEHVKAHVLIIHGEADAEVPIAHGHLIASKCRNLYEPWWVAGGTHNDIDYTFRRAYFLKIAKFLRHVRDFNIEKSNRELDQFYRVGLWHHQSNHIYVRKVKEIEEKYERMIKENGKKTLKDTSFLSGTSLITQKSLRDKMINDVKDEKDPKDFNLTNLEYDETEAGGQEGRAYLPPNLPSKSISIRNQNKTIEMETNTFSLTGNIKELELIEEGKSGPRQVKFQSQRVDSKENVGTTARDTSEDHYGEGKGVL